MASAAEQLASNVNWGAFAKADVLKKRIWFTLGALDDLSGSGPTFRCRGSTRRHSRRSSPRHKQGVLELFNMFSGGAVQRMAIFALEHHAVYFGVDHHPAADLGDPVARNAQERGRVRSARSSTSTPAISRCCSPRSRPTALPSGSKVSSNVVTEPGWFFRGLHRADPDGRYDVPDVARRADHVARHRQRLLADYLRWHHRGVSFRDRQHARARPPGRDLVRRHPRRGGHVDRRSSPSSCSWSGRNVGF